FELIAINPVKLRAPVPERVVPMVRVGMEVTLTVEATPGKIFNGTVTRVAPAIDDVTRTLLIEAEVANPDGVLRPGAFAHITANLGEGRALFVPKAAVLRYAGVARVFVIENDVAHTREVTTGDAVGELIEISRGLKAGETVATTEVDRLADGVAVDPRQQQTETRS
ncbi:MAG: efflux RND transporter periplasmic adaptor subunit, partial [bacterium]